ncbi:TPA: hypothetical protein ACE6JV_002270, partial [Neisseria gonorrhoeae]
LAHTAPSTPPAAANSSPNCKNPIHDPSSAKPRDFCAENKNLNALFPASAQKNANSGGTTIPVFKGGYAPQNATETK